MYLIENVVNGVSVTDDAAVVDVLADEKHLSQNHGQGIDPVDASLINRPKLPFGQHADDEQRGLIPAVPA